MFSRFYNSYIFNSLTGILICFVLFAQVASGPKKPSLKKSDLGKILFFDPILSGDSSVSCGACHKPDFAFADTSAFSVGVFGKRTKRNTPSVLNMANRDLLFWDGRAKSLEDQVLFPIQDHDEMNLTIPNAIERLDRSKKYRKLFIDVFGHRPDKKSLMAAIASYEASLETSDSRFDLYMRNALEMTNEEKAGQKLFVGKAKCFDCHFSPDFTSDEFKNIGLFNGEDWNDSGRIRITKKPDDLGKFKIPGLRNVAVTAPYMHNGRFKTLREVIDYYNNPGAFVKSPQNMDTTMARGLNLTEIEKQELEAFLRALTDKRFVKSDEKN